MFTPIFFLNVGNGNILHTKFLFFIFFKFKKFNIPSISKTIHPHDLVHVPAKFRENTAMRFWATVRKLNVTDGQTDGRTGGIAISPVPGPTAPAGDKAMRFWVTVRKLNVTDGQIDRQTDGRTNGGGGGRCNISRPRAYGAGGR